MDGSQVLDTATQPDPLMADEAPSGWAHVVCCGNIALGVYRKRSDAIGSILMTWPEAELLNATRTFTKYYIPSGNALRLETEATIVLVQCPSDAGPLLTNH